MTSLAALKSAVRNAFRYSARQKDIREAEVFASSTGRLMCRLNYTSTIPCNGVEEPKSSETFGIGIRAVFAGAEVPLIGFGSETRDLSGEGIRRALEKARLNAVPDPDFVTLPASFVAGPQRTGVRGQRAARLGSSRDSSIMSLNDEELVEAGWKVINEALKAFSTSNDFARLAGSPERRAALGLIVGGDVSFFQQRMAIASTRMPTVQTDESTFVTSFVTAMVERYHAKGSGYAATTHLSKFKGEAGSEAASRAVQAAGGQRLPSGTYTVIFGPQAVSDILMNVLLPSLSADAFYSSRSAFLGEIGHTIASPALSISDQGAARGLVGSKAITCEGLPTGRTTLIQDGVLRGLLSNHYETQRLLHDPHSRTKLGIVPHEHLDALTPRNGFRSSSNGGRQFDRLPTIAATNVLVESSRPQSRQSLFRQVGDVVYIGRIWYTYPMNGLRAGDFTCTVVGDSFLVRDGQPATPLLSNTIRISDNIRRLLVNILGVTDQARPIVTWGADEVVYAPEIAVRGVPLTAIAQFMEAV